MATENTVPESTPESGNESLRDTLDAAFEQHEAAPDPGERAPLATPQGEPAGDDRPRDEQGRFIQKTPAEGSTSPQEARSEVRQPTGTIPPAPAPENAADRAPGSWRPEAREKWISADPLIKGEVQRREREFQTHLQQAAGQRQFIEAFENTVRPYEMFIRAENSNPLQAVQNLMATAAELRVGTPASKANLVAGLIKNFNVDIGTLDSILAGTMPGGQMPQQQQQVLHDPRLDQLLAQQQMMMQQREQYEQQEINSEVGQFAADPKHEFFEDVRSTMGDLIEMAARQGRILPVEDAYQRACKLDDGISKILGDRAAAANAAPLTQAALRAKRAAQSLKGDSTLHDGATVPKDDSIRAAIEAAFDSASSR